MHPPWIALPFFIFCLGLACNPTSGNPTTLESQDNGNSTKSRTERETNERERRLIPYMMYYVAQSTPDRNSGTRHNVFVPVHSPHALLQLKAFQKIPNDNLQNLPSQQLHLLTKPFPRLQNPQFATNPSVQIPQGRPRTQPNIDEIQISQPNYRQEPTSQQQVHSQPIQSGRNSQIPPQQIINVHGLPFAQKYSTPQPIKINPFNGKVIADDLTLKNYGSLPPQHVYTSAKLQSLIPNPQVIKEQSSYATLIDPQTENSYKENKVYALQGNQYIPSNPASGFKVDNNKYTVTRIIVSSSTTPSPYTTPVKFELGDARIPKIVGGSDQVPLTHFSPSPAPYRPASQTTDGPSYAGAFIRNQPDFRGSQDSVHSQKIERLPRLRVPQEEDFHYVATVTPIAVSNDLGNGPHPVNLDLTSDGDAKTNNKKPNPSTYLSILKETKNLPQNLTPDNIDSGIKILAFILERLQQEKSYQDFQAELPISVSSTPKIPSLHKNDGRKKKVHNFPQPSGTSTPGKPGVDYPIYSKIPQTSFDCSTQRYKGFFGDPDTNCQVWHYCDLNGGQASFLCPNGTIFSQVALTCDWWFNVKCATTSQLYVLNERLYKYILPFSPSFPEDYSGPVVDRYLSARFKEMEAKSKIKALKSVITTVKPETATDITTDSLEESQTLTPNI